mmetsp:Transcript_25215/g.22053  ORF Transcript_25215/g.22053 Transcript_25215/m.22053 type:complete len:256 (+) Transcript_25215:134-901(+)|eukprot:CAMPEP_0201564716 /NCGR_PEP_ID=MMETSP0190_2-20130828/3246_1 /ASSEMBLY_ACC=CAM_ASM_000263 /TAXON_ID=37353 /ORGANISM="Rosalina sp." /LENGTH=255 /DNA_ID=CAMNT_0047981255 /DNA_START=104 /DNA_END=871 /DNA_ORIENTATION=-
MSTDGYRVMGHQTTEWEDALAKHKIIEKTKRPTPNDIIDTKAMWEAKEKDPYADKTLEDLDELEDEIEEDKLHELRQQRLAELQEKAKADKFGRIKQISKPEYTKEVTEASEMQPVVCCLFVHGQEASQILLKYLEKLAAKFKSVKFVKIVGQEAIPNYKDSFCPTLVIYKDGDPIGNIKGLFNFGGKKVINADILEWELAQSTSIWKTTLEENPRKFKLKKIGGSNNNANKKYTIVKKSNVEDEDSDSDSLDLD